MFRKSFATLALIMCAASAFAMPKPSDVEAAYKAHDYPRAESMLKEVLAVKDSAKAHWQLGQVYSAEGKHKQGLAEMQTAARLDPSFKFASTAAAGVRIMSNEQALAAPPAVVVQSPIAIPQGYAVVAQAAPNPAPVQADSGGHGGLIVFLLLLVAAGVGAYFLFFGKKKEEKEATIAREEAASAQKAQLLDNSKDLEDAILIAKTSVMADSDREVVLLQIAELQRSVRAALSELKDGKGVSNSSLNKLNELVAQVTERAQHGLPDMDSKPTPMPPRIVKSDKFNAPPGVYEAIKADAPYRQTPTTFGPPVVPAPAPTYSAPAPTQTVFHHYPAPAPVVINNGGNDMLTGLLIGEALSRPERVVERTVYVEERAPAPAPYYAPSPPPYEAPAQLDTSTDDDSYDRSSSSLDSSSSSDDSWSSDSSSSDSSSSDSGSSDSW
jgi:hypothetical protein